MGWLLMLVQLALWIGSSIFIVDNFNVDSLILRFFIYGVTGVTSMMLCAWIASMLGLTNDESQ